jgi:hypothetical protein
MLTSNWRPSLPGCSTTTASRTADRRLRRAVVKPSAPRCFWPVEGTRLPARQPVFPATFDPLFSAFSRLPVLNSTLKDCHAPYSRHQPRHCRARCSHPVVSIRRSSGGSYWQQQRTLRAFASEQELDVLFKRWAIEAQRRRDEQGCASRPGLGTGVGPGPASTRTGCRSGCARGGSQDSRGGKNRVGHQRSARRR